MVTGKPESIDEYIAGFPEDVQKKLNDIRKTIGKTAPAATEAIKYAMPTFVPNGNLIHFAAYKNHIGIYPAPVNNESFKQDFAGYKASKGTLQLPLDRPVPLTLIAKIVKHRIEAMLKEKA